MKKDINAPSIAIYWDKEKDITKEEMFKDISVLTEILTKYGYEVKIKYEDCNVYVLEYCYEHSYSDDFGCERFIYVTLDEEEKILNDRCQEEEDK